MRHPSSMHNRLSPIVLAIATALAAPAAFAAPASNALPTNGVVTYNGGASVVANTSQIANNPGVPGLTTYSTGLTINISGTVASANTPVVIDWNTSSTGTTLNPAASGGGFNVGSQAVASFVNSAQLSGNTPTTVNVLNIDTTGNPSQIYGQLDMHGNGGTLWVANANGIVVGSGAAIIAPGGLGLISSPNATSGGTLATSFTSGTAAINFSGATAGVGGVTVDRNANLSGVGTFLLVAGNNNVNVATTPGSGNLYIDGGIGANVTTTTGVMTPNDASGNYGDATTAVLVNVGTTASPYANLTALVDGNLTNMGSLTVTQGQINWINGTFVNYGTLDVTPVQSPLQSYGVLGFNTFTTQYIPLGLTSNTQTVYGNTANPFPTGNFENAGTVNVTAAGSNGFVFFGAGFQNDLGATLNVSGSDYLITSSNGVTLAGIQNSLSGGLTVAALGANSVVNIQSPVTASTGILLAANTANISSTVTVTTPGNFTFYGPESGAAQMNLASGGSITGANLYLGTQGSASPTNFVVNGMMDGTSSVLFGGANTPTGNVSGAGSITTPSLTFANLQGSVNNIISPVIALNGFHVTGSGTNGAVHISVTADSSQAQGVNLMVNGNLTIDTGGTIAIEPGYLPNNATGGTESLAPANAGSILYVQASGSITATDPLAPNNYGGIAVPNTTYGLFQFPGLVYLQSGTTLDVGSLTTPVVIANAYSPNATFGRAGVFLIAPTINYNNGVANAQVLYTNGNAGVVFAAPYNGLGFPNATINGTPSSTSNLMPQIDFLRAVTPTTTYPYGLELVPTDTFTNANGNQQQFQTFLNLY
ncbi:beta strand repeat-containing protein [Acidithiobacillus sulfuriphilus]|uniref:beta strand repeat-containing protein n=1 Tax=Acidithiobacillus sulfuriphilus TaxID=1867749 RepID=UPI003F5FE8B6